MRWESLFADMEAQLAAAQVAELEAQVADLTRAERATVPLAGRLRAARGRPLTVRVRGGDLVGGSLVDVAEQWLLLGDGPRRALVPLAAVVAVGGLPAAADPAEGGRVARRLGLGHALRALARDRLVVRVAADGVDVVGRPEGVGADHVDVVPVVDPGAARSGAAGAWAIPFAAIRAVHSG